MKSPEGTRLLAAGDIASFNGAYYERERAVGAMFGEALRGAARGADLIVSTALTTYRGMALAEHFGVPHGVLATMPWLSNGAYAVPLGPVRSLGLALNRATYKLFWRTWWRGQRDLIADMRLQLGLPPLRQTPDVEALPHARAYGGALSPRPGDLPSDGAVTGFITPTAELRAKLGEAAVSPELEAWLRTHFSAVHRSRS